ncbi:DUF4845 domain-containing protein [Roseateles sp. BYS180W]|uniref:DUF4845 domain-containing protein n=1 Tax=Roseateles rivi TaxID=3299028 RepID=A0ABW7FSF6_9BURK
MTRTQAGQRGLSLIGLLFWAVLIGFFGIVAIRTAPSVMEYYTVLKAVNRIASGSPLTVGAARQEFERIKQVEYSIVSISASDLDVTKVNDKVKISFAYDKEIEIAGPVYLLIKYRGESQ